MRRATWDNFKKFMGEAISIHALREEGDDSVAKCYAWIGISIHALREEGDKHNLRTLFEKKDFYPRPP